MSIDMNRIDSFPTSKRKAVNKLMTENSVTRLINRLIDNDSYVITTGIDGANSVDDIPVDNWIGHDFEFIIKGYYFSILKEKDNPTSSGLAYLIREMNFNFEGSTEPHRLYARIFIDKTDPNFPELYGQDDSDNVYKSINFYIDEEEISYPVGYDSSNLEVYDAHLLSYIPRSLDHAPGNFVTLDCLAKFSSRSIADIDGGEIILTDNR